MGKGKGRERRREKGGGHHSKFLSARHFTRVVVVAREKEGGGRGKSVQSMGFIIKPEYVKLSKNSSDFCQYAEMHSSPPTSANSRWFQVSLSSSSPSVPSLYGIVEGSGGSEKKADLDTTASAILFLFFFPRLSHPPSPLSTEATKLLFSGITKASPSYPPLPSPLFSFLFHTTSSSSSRRQGREDIRCG